MENREDGGEAEADVIVQFTVDEAIEKIGFGCFQLKLILFSALVVIADAMEIMLLAVLGPAVQCLWLLSNYEEAMIATVVFVGMMLGSPVWGFVCDRYGRKKTLFICTLFIVYFGIVTSFSPSYYWLLFFRFLVGFFITSSAQITTYLSEFLPIQCRATSILSLKFSFAFGTCFQALLAYLVMEKLGWRYLVGLTAVPVLLVLFLFPFVPVSPRYLIVENKVKEAYKVLLQIAKQNRKQIPPGELVHEKYQPVDQEATPFINEENTRYTISNLYKKYKILELFNRTYILTTLFLLIIWFGSGFSYYGAILFSTQLFIYDNHCIGAGDSNSTNSLVYCSVLSNYNYLQIFITSLAEIPGSVLTLVLLETIGRKLSMTVVFLLCGMLYLLLFTCTGQNDYIVKTVILFGIRSCVSGIIQSAYVYTAEVYPTRIRALSLSLCSTASRFGALLTPYVANVLFKLSLPTTILVYVGIVIVSAVFSFLLPYETKGTKLGQEEERKFLRFSKPAFIFCTK